VPSLVGSAVAVSFVGVFIGPHYPIVLSAVTKVLPRSHVGGAIGWIGMFSPPVLPRFSYLIDNLLLPLLSSASFGQAGSAVFPFIVGAISGRHGLASLNPVVVAMLTLLIGLWAAGPRIPRAKA
jgi:fucose permease